MIGCTGSAAIVVDGHSGEQVAVAPPRAGRPGTRHGFEAARVRLRAPLEDCPFCAGHEARTPPTPLALPAEPGWRVRAFANRYPALLAPATQEVVVHGAEHRLRLAACPADVLADVGLAWATRIDAQRRAGRPWVVPLINEGAASGSSLDHAHSQLVATATAPPRLARELALARAGADVLADADDALVVHADHDLVAFAPRASRSSYELRVARTSAVADPADEPELVARALGLAVGLLDRALGDVALSVWLHHAPPGQGPLRWHVEAFPRLGVLGGLELGVGYLVCETPPAVAARAFRGEQEPG